MGDLAEVAAAAYGRSKHLQDAIGILAESRRAMLIIDAQDGEIVHANDAASELFAGSLIGTSVERLMPARYRSGHRELRRSFAAAARTRPMSAGVDVLALTAESGESTVRVGLTPIPGTALVIAEIDPLGPPA